MNHSLNLRSLPTYPLDDTNSTTNTPPFGEELVHWCVRYDWGTAVFRLLRSLTCIVCYFSSRICHSTTYMDTATYCNTIRWAHIHVFSVGRRQQKNRLPHENCNHRPHMFGSARAILKRKHLLYVSGGANIKHPYTPDTSSIREHTQKQGTTNQ